jgi:WD40 repeat protein
MYVYICIYIRLYIFLYKNIHVYKYTYIGVIYDVKWSNDDSYLLSCSGDGTSKIWDVLTISTGTCVMYLFTYLNVFICILFISICIYICIYRYACV